MNYLLTDDKCSVLKPKFNGQQHVQDVTVCVNDETYDQVLLWKAIEKYRPMISASAHLPTTEHQHNRIEALLNESLARNRG
jgi:hypothetical protein